MNCLKCGTDIGNEIGLCSACRSQRAAEAVTNEDRGVRSKEHEPSSFISRQLIDNWQRPIYLLGLLIIGGAIIYSVAYSVWASRKMDEAALAMGIEPGGSYQLRMFNSSGILGPEIPTSPVTPGDCRAMSPTNAVIFHGVAARPEYSFPPTFDFACCSTWSCLYYRGIAGAHKGLPVGAFDRRNNRPPVSFCCLEKPPTSADVPSALPCSRDPRVPVCR